MAMKFTADQVQVRRRYANLDDEGRGRQVPGRDDREDMYKAGGAGLDNMMRAWERGWTT